MCSDAEGRAVRCGSDLVFVRLCEAEADNRAKAILDAHPILRDWEPSAANGCCQRDEIIDAGGTWQDAWAWDELKFLTGRD